jgi:hypothetical protein
VLDLSLACNFSFFMNLSPFTSFIVIFRPHSHLSLHCSLVCYDVYISLHNEPFPNFTSLDSDFIFRLRIYCGSRSYELYLVASNITLECSVTWDSGNIHVPI